MCSVILCVWLSEAWSCIDPVEDQYLFPTVATEWDKSSIQKNRRLIQSSQKQFVIWIYSYRLRRPLLFLVFKAVDQPYRGALSFLRLPYCDLFATWVAVLPKITVAMDHVWNK